MPLLLLSVSDCKLRDFSGFFGIFRGFDFDWSWGVFIGFFWISIANWGIFLGFFENFSGFWLKLSDFKRIFSGFFEIFRGFVRISIEVEGFFEDFSRIFQDFDWSWGIFRDFNCKLRDFSGFFGISGGFSIEVEGIFGIFRGFFGIPIENWNCNNYDCWCQVQSIASYYFVLNDFIKAYLRLNFNFICIGSYGNVMQHSATATLSLINHTKRKNAQHKTARS